MWHGQALFMNFDIFLCLRKPGGSRSVVRDLLGHDAVVTFKNQHTWPSMLRQTLILLLKSRKQNCREQNNHRKQINLCSYLNFARVSVLWCASTTFIHRYVRCCACVTTMCLSTVFKRKKRSAQAERRTVQRAERQFWKRHAVVSPLWKDGRGHMLVGQDETLLPSLETWTRPA